VGASKVAPVSGSDEPAREDDRPAEKCKRTTTRHPAGRWRKRFQMPPRCRSRRRKEADFFANELLRLVTSAATTLTRQG